LADGLVWFTRGWQIALLPAFVIFAAIAFVGPALWITALNLKYRDFRLVIPFIVLLGLYVSPLGFSSHIVLPCVPGPLRAEPDPGSHRRRPLVHSWWTEHVNVSGLALSLMIGILFLWFGVRQYRKTEAIFADLI
jgi:lipopolysaccharide transport system permease protein